MWFAISPSVAVFALRAVAVLGKLLLPRHCRNQLESIAAHVLYERAAQGLMFGILSPCSFRLVIDRVARCCLPCCLLVPRLDLSLDRFSLCWWECSFVSSD